MLTTSSLIEVSQQDDGTFRVKVGEETVFKSEESGLANLVVRSIRLAYAAGRRDQRAETAAILRSLMSTG